MESMNPSGSGKDRAVQHMLDVLEAQGVVQQHSVPPAAVVEGTSGSTGIALAFQCLNRGYQLHIVMPNDQAEEKKNMLEMLGAKVQVVKVMARWLGSRLTQLS